MDPKEIEPGEIVTTEDGTDEDGYPIRSVNIGAPAATIGVTPGENG